MVGEPRDIGSAHALALQDREQFEYWALSLIGARPYEGRQQKGADRGRDGLLIFEEGDHLPIRRAIVSVKSGNVTSRDVRDLRGVIERDKAELGLFVT